MSIKNAQFNLFKLTFGFSLVLVALIVGLLIWANNCLLEESVPGFGELVPEVKETAVRASTRGLIVALFTFLNGTYQSNFQIGIAFKLIQFFRQNNCVSFIFERFHLARSLHLSFRVTKTTIC